VICHPHALSRGPGVLEVQKDFGTDPWRNSLVSMAHDREPGWYDLAETIPEDHRVARLVEARKREQWLFRPCDACGDTYRVWGTQVELLPCCGGTKCKRDRER
jgi:hypothetical protein